MSTNPWETSNKSLFITQKEHEKLISDLVLRLEECTKRIDVLESTVFSLSIEESLHHNEHELFYEKVYIKNPMSYPFHELPAITPHCEHPVTVSTTDCITVIPDSISDGVIG